MSRTWKIWLIVFFAICAATGYSIYWWHESSLDRIALYNLSYKGPTLDRVQKALDDKRPSEARGILDRQPTYEKIGILKVLTRHERTSVRMFAVRYMRKMRDVPEIRAELARIIAEETDDTVSRLAGRAIQGRR